MCLPPEGIGRISHDERAALKPIETLAITDERYTFIIESVPSVGNIAIFVARINCR